MTTAHPNKLPFRVLSLDGGGIRGAFTASCLARLEVELGCSVTQFFDLIVGTSTGGIIALALALGEPAERIRQFYRDRGPQIFTRREPPHIPIWQRTCLAIAKRKFPKFDDGTLYRSKYQQEPLRAALYEVYSDRTLEEATASRVVITSVDLIHGRTITFKTPHQPDFIRDRKFRVIDIALATAAAPTYFPQASIGPGTFFSDGGLWANNPAIVGYAEAIKISQVCRRPDVDPRFGSDDIFMLSIGTGRPQYYANPGPTDDGLLWWGPRLFDIAGGAQAQGIHFQARYLLGDEKYARIDFDMPTEPWPLDAYDAVPQMLHYGEQAAVDNYALLKKMFFSFEKVTYKPFAL